MPEGSGPVDGCVGGRYAIQSELARGGMGEVFRVLDRSTGRVLALKRSLPDDPDAVMRNAALLEREYKTLVTLKHPYIIEVHDFGVDGESSFYTMELLDGDDLRARSPVDWRVLCANLRDVASSLALLHSRRLLHRDVSAANIRLTGEGRAKLIDFGTLMSFGKTDLIAGTPPGVAPETLEGTLLDQRVDLYALGATAYYALTKRHAYPARSLREVVALWGRGPPRPPSVHVPGIPAELDELVLSLLSMDPSLRPSSAAEVIDRLGAIAGLSPEEDARIAQSYLVGHALIGREKEGAKLSSRLERAMSGRGSILLVSSAAGLGRSTLLSRFDSEARVKGALVLSADARAHQYPLGVWHALVQRAFADVPERAAGARAALTRAPEEQAHPRRASGAETTQKLAGHAIDERDLPRFFVALAANVPLVLLVDDVHVTDNESLSLFASLGREAANRRLLVVASADTDDPRSGGPAMQLLRRGAGRVRLSPFDPEQTEQLVRSMFGEVASTRRLASWLQQQSAGSPSLCSVLVAHLVREGRIHYAEGTWVLPHDFPTSDVQAIVTSAVLERLSRLRLGLRRFLECLSVHRRWLDAELCGALADGDPELEGANVARLLEELVREGVLIGDSSGFAFARPHMRDVLYAGLSEGRRRSLHRHAAQTLGLRASGNPEREFEVGWHLLLAGDRAEAYTRIAESVVEVVSRPDVLVRAVPELRDLYAEYRRIGATRDELLLVTASLVVSGYYVDPSVHDELGDDTATLLCRRAGFALATRLSPWVGSYLALFVGMAWGTVQYAWAARTLRIHQFGSIVLSFVGVCAARSAVGYLRLEPGTHQLLLRLLSPARGLHRHNGVRLVYDLIAIAFAEARGAFGDVHDGYLDQLARLRHVRLFTEEARHHYEAGLLCSLGRCNLYRMGDGALECADRVDAMGGQHDRILAQYLRCSHYLYRGETSKADAAHEVLDETVARYGYRWIPDILEVLDFVPYHLSGDVVGLKRVLHRTERVMAMAPAYTTYRDVIRAMYEGHRGRPEVALGQYDALEGALRPFAHPAWSFAQGHRAECLNALGRHEQALAVCEAALSHVGELRRVYVLPYEQLERERAIALAGMGRAAEAARLLDELLERHESDSQPLVIGLIHRDRARVARSMGDDDAFGRHSRAMADLFSATKNATLLTQARRLAERPPSSEAGTARSTPTDGGEPFGLLQSVAGASLDVVASHALDYIVRLAGASHGYLFLLQQGRPTLVARTGEAAVTSQLEVQVAHLLANCRIEEEASTTATPVDTPNESSALTLLPLLVQREGDRVPIGAAAVYECQRPQRLTDQLAGEIAIALRAGAVTVVDGGHPPAEGAPVRSTT